MSLRRRIILLAMGVATLVLVVFMVPLALLLQQSARESAVERATDVAHGVADYVSTATDAGVLEAYVARVNQRSDDVQVAVMLPDGTRVGANEDRVRLGTTITPGDGGDGDLDHDHGDGDFAATSSAEVHSVDGGRLVTVTVRTDGGPSVVGAYYPADAIRKSVWGRILILIAAGLGSLVLAAVAAELVSRRLIRSLTDTAVTADRLSEGELEARAPENGPAEVRRVAVALNRLAGRIDELLVAERETVADLSHRLRTPLTAVRLDVEALPDTPARAELAQHLGLLERTLTAVIRAARRPEREGVAPATEPTQVIRDRVEFWAPLMEDQGREVTVDLRPPLGLVRCSTEDLAAALDALLENVVAHTPEQTPVGVVAFADSSGVQVEVRDQGPGIPPGATGRGRSDRGSSGLGLDIARACAEISGGGLSIGREGNWTVVRLHLGPAQVPHSRS